MVYKLVLGDWSEDGHSMSKDILFDCNYDVHAIRQAYKDSCKKLGIIFNCNRDYTGLNLGYKSERRLWTEYEESGISKATLGILNNANCLDGIEYYEEDGSYYIDDYKDCAKLIMNFIAVSMPQDFTYKLVQEPKIEPINGLWNDELNVTFGYGLFYS